MSQPSRLLLQDVGEFTPKREPSPAARLISSPGLGRDDDPDLLDPRLRHRLDSIEEHGLVRHRYQFLGARMGDRAQTRPLPLQRESDPSAPYDGQRTQMTLRRHLKGPAEVQTFKARPY